jgi:hypothetical protein
LPQRVAKADHGVEIHVLTADAAGDAGRLRADAVGELLDLGPADLNDLSANRGHLLARFLRRMLDAVEAVADFLGRGQGKGKINERHSGG